MLQNIFRTSSRIISLNSCLLRRSAFLVTNPKLHNTTKVSTNRSFCKRINKGMADEAPKFTNRLAEEKSPYLLQHAHNPVDWYPWGEEALQKAKDENKLIFLSIGYSSCHWCHVMENESFCNEEIAEIMNKHYVNIKVDREERPDLDKIYMNFVLLINGSGGWPMSVWLTPDLAPITGGTYFPPETRNGYPGFPTVLEALASKWEKGNEEIAASGMKIVESVRESLYEKPSDIRLGVDKMLEDTQKILKHRFDTQYGGFDDRPKFPEVSRINFIFHLYFLVKDEDVLNMATRTLKKIGNGGIHDHVFGGFARYAVDRRWHVPHFEKMLYDQGQFMVAFTNAFKITRDKFFLNVADGVFSYIMEDLKNPLGGFYAGEDADSLPSDEETEKVEGAFYVWDYHEIKNLIMQNNDIYEIDADDVFEIYRYHYDICERGNVEPSSDPHGHLSGKNIPAVRRSVADTADEFTVSVKVVEDVLRTTNEILHEERNKRPRPHLDTKIITSWNGLTLSGIARLAECGGDKRTEYIKAAEDLYKFMRKYLYDGERKVLLRTCYGNLENIEEITTHQIDGFLDDYAFFIRGLIDFYRSTLDWELLHFAKELQDIQDELFWDDENSGYFFSKADAPGVLLRLKEDSDGSEPCGNSVASRNLLLLSHYFDDEGYRQKLDKMLDFFTATSRLLGYIMPEMMSTRVLFEKGMDLVIIVGPESEETKRFVTICQSFYMPDMILVRIDPDNPNEYSTREGDTYKLVNDKPTVYICRGKACQIPITDAEELEENLKEHYLGKYVK